MSKAYTVRDLPLSERPRERMARLGPEVLSAQEILALLMGRGTRGEPVMTIAQNLLKKFGNLRGIAGASIAEITQVPGIGAAKATQLKAAFELSKRLDDSLMPFSKQAIKSPQDIVHQFNNRLKDKKKEHFFVILLNTRNQVIGEEEVSVGSLDSSIVHPREVFKPAVASSAASVILVHNHPSGDSQPSEEDVALTKRLAEAAGIFGIQVLDHIIIGDGNSYSLKARGAL